MRRLAGIEPPPLADLRADKETGEIFAGIVGSSLPMSGSVRAPNMSPSKPDFPLSAAAAPRSNSEREGLSGRLRRRGASESAEDGVIAQGGEQFPGDEGLERDDALALDPRPFRMRAGQHNEARAGIGDAKDFRLLAPHHIRQSGVIDIGQPRRERDAPAVGLDFSEMRTRRRAARRDI